jgi:CBS domain-containing membrane protein
MIHSPTFAALTTSPDKRPDSCIDGACSVHPFLAWLSSFIPAPITAGRRERFYGALGAGIGLACTEDISHQALGAANPWFIAPMGASAVLLFAVPASPLAQPWSIIGGNLVSAAGACFGCATARA